ncbi:unnamed protein product [Ostreobium quekettii]|uniref:UBX domain-containing protein n=1 Tax=Ostreobium quekettii TaxID=121088 RepID=A0A8S1J493_9CHLO|nr:unnamed protein product [Ostreobium quekettii]|eukprot:evm.model.scf_236.8 EVM.evm.TU.scf_236.8   scf_236:101545-106267(+)
MLSSELRSRQRKLEREAKERLQNERRKREKERRVAEEVKRRQAEWEEVQRERREAQRLAQEHEEARMESDREQNRGVFLEATLTATPVPDSAALAKGIKRWRDKVLLPPSFGAELMNQEASKNGGLLFEITAPSGGHTCAGLLEFSAPEGTVGLPKKVIQSLWGPEGQCVGQVRVSYKLLPPGTYARLQPVRHGFHEALGEYMRDILESALMEHSTLTEGDWIEVDHHGVTHDLKVLELKPSPSVSVVDTDLEADVGPSEEVEAALKAEEEAARRAEEERRQFEEAWMQHEREREAREQQEAELQAKLAEERRNFAAAKAASLPPEIDADCPVPWMLAVVRGPDGSRWQRRFKLGDPVSLLFDFVDSKGAGGCGMGQYRLVTQFPRRVLLPDSSATLQESGLVQRQEAFLVEPTHN